MTASAFAALLGVWIAAIASPGPDVVQIIRVGSRDRAAGMACAAGIMVGNTAWILASLLGLSALVQAAPRVLAVLQVVGGAYLLHMGAGALRAAQAAWAARGSRAAETEHPAPAAPQLTPRRAFGLGVATNLANPKALLFFAAVFAQFVRPDMGWQWMAAIAATLIFTGAAWFVGFAAAVRALARPIQRYGAAIDAVTGAIFSALAVWMLCEGLSALAGFS